MLILKTTKFHISRKLEMFWVVLNSLMTSLSLKKWFVRRLLMFNNVDFCDSSSNIVKILFFVKKLRTSDVFDDLKDIVDVDFFVEFFLISDVETLKKVNEFFFEILNCAKSRILDKSTIISFSICITSNIFIEIFYVSRRFV